MNRDDILNMEAGREMDDLIATRVMGWKMGNTSVLPRMNIPVWHDGNWNISHFYEWRPSTDIAAAWEAVDKLRKDGFNCVFSLPYTNSAIRQHILFDGGEETDARSSDWVYGDELPLAICRAALLAVMEAE
jgi:hypothetical protein